ncbi:hypothetical protein [Wolbachia endosymbiont of Onchocerca volvulus]|uniref:hypothetical protein n=1 Tax=Onchocerca volvulus endobacterium TaxID=77551 RepID=UPI00046CFF79|nr:hypothetical protein [Wolbachia endosymbiont of Onchocerca volvulus]
MPLAPSPPPFCKQLTIPPPKVKIVPITNENNDYFEPKVKVIVSDLTIEDGKIEKELDFSRKYKKDNNDKLPTTDEIKKHFILNKD